MGRLSYQSSNFQLIRLKNICAISSPIQVNNCFVSPSMQEAD